MYVALKKLETKSGPVLPGQIVLDAPTWPETVLNAHLNLEWIKFVPDKDPPAPPKSAKVTTEAPPQEPPVTTQPPKTDEPAAWLCFKENCGKSFTSKRGLGVHVKMAHKAE